MKDNEYVAPGVIEDLKKRGLKITGVSSDVGPGHLVVRVANITPKPAPRRWVVEEDSENFHATLYHDPNMRGTTVRVVRELKPMTKMEAWQFWCCPLATDIPQYVHQGFNEFCARLRGLGLVVEE